ncbi:MAG: 4Fe-4S ferredoxin [Chlorobiaceae bacterium]|nr:4Fe-4S ferredoxin [Chlorobiaceae bacterium]MBA4309280.1 4Fe-4S ferredoxin [Chlorobiaceae bacterium]
MLRKIVNIDQEKCDGCALCIPTCAEGALQIINNKAYLISDLFCDGLGACLGHCPQGAITIEEREAEPYDEIKTMQNVIRGGNDVIKAHLLHLKNHGEMEYFLQGLDYLNEIGMTVDLTETEKPKNEACGCPGSQSIDMRNKNSNLPEEIKIGKQISQLTQWPIQLHLISPYAEYYRGSHLLLAADCCAFSYGNFHSDFMKGRSIAIACPKLDTNKEIYLEKIISLIDNAKLKSITVTVMQVPCCAGLYQLTQKAVESAERKIPLEVVVIGIDGEILKKVSLN